MDKWSVDGASWSYKYLIGASELRKGLGLEEKAIVIYHGIFTPRSGIFERVSALSKVRHDDAEGIWKLGKRSGGCR